MADGRWQIVNCRLQIGCVVPGTWHLALSIGNLELQSTICNGFDYLNLKRQNADARHKWLIA